MAARKAKFSEHAQCFNWMRDVDMFDPAVLDYPTCEVLVAPEDHPTSCLPIHLTVTLESLGHDKDSEPAHRLAATLECLMLAAERAKSVQAKEIYYIASDGKVDKRAEQLGFERVWCYRRKI